MRKIQGHNYEDDTFEEQIRGFLEQGKEKLMKELEGTRGAIKLLAQDKTRDFMRLTDIGFSREERQLLSEVIVSSMYQSFCYGYGIGKMEGSTKRKIYL